MNGPPRQFRTFERRQLLWLLPLMLGIWTGLAHAGIAVDVAFLAAMSAVPIIVTAFSYRDAADDLRYWITIAGYCALHELALHFIGGDWIPSPAVALTPLFLLDYLLLAYLFPKLSGLRFD